MNPLAEGVITSTIVYTLYIVLVLIGLSLVFLVFIMVVDRSREAWEERRKAKDLCCLNNKDFTLEWTDNKGKIENVKVRKISVSWRKHWDNYIRNTQMSKASDFPKCETVGEMIEQLSKIPKETKIAGENQKIIVYDQGLVEPVVTFDDPDLWAEDEDQDDDEEEQDD